ncbi:HAD-IB family hydrolase [Synechococcus sp. CB0101]|uniref:HAD-IB family hydrolase n=1 Tax=Synechococcus sp. CB0101 TaxID=232348 RepID=UPI0002001C17|nr:HAD-IB family hydrolase [Synechococcus sp. CB0101]QCH15003.1 HAD-IB family hydrolase [Synechococcus sp. CB0101]
MSGTSPVATRSRPVAAFDFDGTLLAGDTLLILHRLVRSPRGQLIDGLLLLPDLLLWKSGQHSTAWFKQRVLQQLLTPAMQRRSAEQRSALLEHSLANALWRQLRPEALARLEWHRQQGHRIVIVSASPRCLLQAIAERLGVELIATETSDPRNGKPIELSSANCKGAEKIRRLQAWLENQPLSHTELHAYGDSRGDRELLQHAAHPHWRSFSAESRPYPTAQGLNRWLTPLALVLLLSALAGLLQLDPATQSSLISGLRQLPAWIPAILAVLAVSYAGRYLRFRMLLGAERIGRISRSEAWVWFQGFALTATPGKLGELARVQQLHRQLGYPRQPLLHAFLAERLCDAAAVVAWLAVLVPGQLLQRLSPPAASTLGISALAALLGLGASIWIWRHRSHWQHHLPSGRLAQACLPACALSLVIWGLEAMILWLLVQAISPTAAFNTGQAISTYLLSGTAGMASLLPGGLGVNEATTTLLLGQAGIPTSLGLSIAILRRLCSVWLITSLAALASWSDRRS